MCIDVLVLEFLQTFTKMLRIALRNMRIYANGERFEFLWMCADILHMCTKKLRVTIRNMCTSSSASAMY